MTVESPARTCPRCEANVAADARFCANCGCGNLAEVAVTPGMTLILAGTLDDPAAFQPVIEFFCDSTRA